MKFEPLLPGRFVKRDNRFRVTVEVDGEQVPAHLPNSGRLTELLIPRRTCWLERCDGAHRKTDFDLKLVEYAGTLVSVDARLPNWLFEEALIAGRLAPFTGYDRHRREVSLGDSRLDFLLTGDMGDESVCWVEVKSVTLVEDRLAQFPDAPTSRGVRHLRELAAVSTEDTRAAVAFVVQRDDAERFAPHDEADPAFGAALRRADRMGVAVYAWRCRVNLAEIVIVEQIPVDLGRE